MRNVHELLKLSFKKRFSQSTLDYLWVHYLSRRLNVLCI